MDETATGSAKLWSRFSRITRVHRPNPPSIDPGIIALVWAVALGAYIYFGLIAIGTSGAFSIVISMVSAAGIWLFVRARGDTP